MLIVRDNNAVQAYKPVSEIDKQRELHLLEFLFIKVNGIVLFRYF